MLTSKILLSCGIFAIAQMLAWFQLYSQFVWQWWEGRAIAAILTFGVPAGFCFWYGTKIAVEAMGEAWGPRLLIFGMSYLTFPVLTWWLLNESMFTAKTMTCIVLSFSIVAVQLLWK